MLTRGKRTVALVVATAALVVALACGSLAVLRDLGQQDSSDSSDFDQDISRAVPRDGFPVFNNPPMVSAEQAAGLRDDDWIIGVTVNGQAKVRVHSGSESMKNDHDDGRFSGNFRFAVLLSLRHLNPFGPFLGYNGHVQAKAYPVAVMGVHELGNDTCGGEPIAVSW
ncbi:MAG: DUF3179 domain-containing protein [Planctomycetes bacterium]|nr:DUF3179 domain-containing protein [Planctomycetota bacterium]